ncbi:hypothetical protein DICVIV_08112 [Dictyocaulus viviparus]|uniref:RRM domain-containing protein n=1 Tax=Dictyocaulus viviparus TaxID=29172 RepID=A0A0D8XU02_DICVI|nr:hypothetical protein DICVIV_08112 [Dictyocaulus viviparus]
MATPATSAAQLVSLSQPVSAPAEPAGFCLLAYNLSPDTEDSILWQLFGPFGAVLCVKVVRDYATAKCKGYAFVTMMNYADACNAIAALNGTQIAGRVMQFFHCDRKCGHKCFPFRESCVTTPMMETRILHQSSQNQMYDSIFFTRCPHTRRITHYLETIPTFAL